MRSVRYLRVLVGVIGVVVAISACGLTADPTPVLILATPVPDLPSTAIPTATPRVFASPQVPPNTPTSLSELLPSTDTPPPDAPPDTPPGDVSPGDAEATDTVQAPVSDAPAPSSYLTGGSEEGGISLRSQPGTGGEVQQMIRGNAPVQIVGRTADNRWMEVVLDDGNRGWVALDDVSGTIDLTHVEVTGETVGAAAVAAVKIDSGGLRLREQPSAAGRVVTNLQALEQLTILGRLGNGQWLQVETSGGYRGWVMANYVTISGDYENVPVVGESVISLAETFDADIIPEGEGLRLRTEPSLLGSVRTRLSNLTPLQIVGRTDDNTWMEVRTPSGDQGWVWAAYLRIRTDLSTVPITGVAVVVTMPTALPLPPSVTGGSGSGSGASGILPGDIVSNITSTSRQIFLRGQQLGNRANVFTKVGDSLTDTPHMFQPIGWGHYVLHQHVYLQPVINFFSSENARDGNSFRNGSFTAISGWGTPTVLDPSQATSGLCRAGETPLECEYRVVRPSVSLILIGTNDVAGLPAETYRANLRRIVQISVDMGVIPVLSTLPDRFPGDNIAGFNAIIVQTAREFDVPIWDLWSVLQSLPNKGRSSDDVHLSAPPGDANLAADFRDDFMQYGNNMRNYTALVVLDKLWREVLSY